MIRDIVRERGTDHS